MMSSADSSGRSTTTMPCGSRAIRCSAAPQRPARVLAADPDQVARRIAQVHAHQRRLAARLAAHERDVQPAVHAIHVPAHAEGAGLGLDHAVGDALDRAFLAEPVTDEVRDRADGEPMHRGKALELGAARHRAVLVQDLDDHRGGLEAREAREVAAGFRVAGAGQHAAGARHQREHVAGLAQVLRPRAGRDRGLHRVRAILRRDAGRDALAPPRCSP